MSAAVGAAGTNNEMQALSEMRRILRTLGEDSIVTTTMDGVLDFVEANVDMQCRTKLMDSIELFERIARQRDQAANRLAEERNALRAENEWLRTRVTKLQKHAHPWRRFHQFNPV